MKNRADGFTLVEVLLAISIFTVGLVSLAQLALLARESDRSAALLTVASVLAQDKMEQLRATPWPIGAAAGCCEYFDAHGVLVANGTNPPIGTEYMRAWSIDPVPAIPDAAVTLRVWVEPRGAATVRLVSVRARRAS